MRVRGTWWFARVTRGAAAAAGLMVLLALQPEPAGLVEAAPNRAGSHARALILSDQARRYLSLQYRSYPTEFMGCMIGEIHGNAVIVTDRARGRGARALHANARGAGADLRGRGL